MKGRGFSKTVLLLLMFLTTITLAQDKFTHVATGIEFWRQVIGEPYTDGSMEWGYALPPILTGANDEYIGYLKGSLNPDRKGWSGISHGGGMAHSLLLVAYPRGENVEATFQYGGDGRRAPIPYTGNATLTQIAYAVTGTDFELVYRCQWCWVWDQEGWRADEQRPTAEIQIIGWARHGDAPSTLWRFHDNGQGIFGIETEKARNDKYAQWVVLAA